MSENNRASVYVHINLVNGKKYFGITTQNPPENRWRNGNGYINNTHFSSAVKKYGWDNFGHFVLYKNIPIKIAKNIEEMLINEHMSYDPDFGYNKTYGGELEKHTKETRRKMSEAKKGKFGADNPTSKDVLCIETGIIYHGIHEANRMTGINFRGISFVCLGSRKTAGGFHWRYLEGGNDDGGDNRG